MNVYVVTTHQEYEDGEGDDMIGIAADPLSALALIQADADKHTSKRIGDIDYLTFSTDFGTHTVEHRRTSAGVRGPCDFNEETYYVREQEVFGAVG